MGQGEKRNSEFDIRAYIIYNVKEDRNTSFLRNVGASIARPRILPKQNPSPQGEKHKRGKVVPKILRISGGRAMLAPTR